MTANSLVVHRPTASSALALFVDCFWIHAGYTQPHARERVLPTGTMGLVFAVDTVGRASSGIAGPRSGFLELDTSRPFSAIGVQFKAGGGSPFFGVPIGELCNHAVPLDLVWGRFAAAIADRLWDADTADEQFRILAGALLEKGGDRLVWHPAVRYAVNVAERSPRAVSVNAVADRIGMSSRRFLDVFRSEVGLSPKAYWRIRRFTAVLNRIARSTDVDWADVALSCGYFDQSHFNHDFRTFSGMSPSAYLRQHISRTHVVVGR